MSKTKPFANIRKALDTPPVQWHSCASYPKCETASDGNPCYHSTHGDCTIRRDIILHQNATVELDMASDLLEALEVLADKADSIAVLAANEGDKATAGKAAAILWPEVLAARTAIAKARGNG